MQIRTMGCDKLWGCKTRMISDDGLRKKGQSVCFKCGNNKDQACVWFILTRMDPTQKKKSCVSFFIFKVKSKCPSA